jgi:hypothetical protein
MINGMYYDAQGNQLTLNPDGTLSENPYGSSYSSYSTSSSYGSSYGSSYDSSYSSSYDSSYSSSYGSSYGSDYGSTYGTSTSPSAVPSTVPTAAPITSVVDQPVLNAYVQESKQTGILGLGKVVAKVEVSNPGNRTLSGLLRVMFTKDGNPTPNVQTQRVTLHPLEKQVLTFTASGMGLSEAEATIDTDNPNGGSTITSPSASPSADPNHSSISDM